MSYTYVIGWVSDINDNTCDDGKRGFPHGDVQSLQADRVRMQAMHWISISHCFVGVFLFFNMIWCSHFFDASKCEHVIQYILGQVYSVKIYWTSMRHPVHAPKNCLQESPHNADLPCPCQPAGSPVRVKWLMIQIQIAMQMQRKHMEKHTGCFLAVSP